jgi:hypothetical protein
VAGLVSEAHHPDRGLREEGQATKEERKRSKALERDLARTKKAPAEAAALLGLRKRPW